MFPYENGTTGIKNLDFNSFIQEQDISIPDIKTQQKIVSILSSIDEKIETNKRINDNLLNTNGMSLPRFVRCPGGRILIYGIFAAVLKKEWSI